MISLPHGIQIGDSVIVKVDGNLVTGTFDGVNEKYELPYVRLENGNRVLRKIYMLASQEAAVQDVQADDSGVVPVMPEVKEFNINTRFDFLVRMVRMVARGISNSLIVSGAGGLGKSFTVRKTMADNGMIEGEDYVVVKGFATPKSLFRKLYESNGMTIVFDDCDSVLNDPKAVNILKACLDSEPVRVVSWLTEAGAADDELPTQFEFTGKVIFLTNLVRDRVPQPMVSRAQLVDVTMTTDEKIERMRNVLPQVRTDVPMEVKTEVLDLLHTFRHRARDLNFRTMLKSLEIRLAEPEVWRDIVEYSVTA